MMKTTLQNRPLMGLLVPLAISICLLVVLPIAYYLNEVRIARYETANLVADAYRKWGANLDLSALDQERMDVLLAIEDPTFFEHRGVDLATPGAGMTTISQGLVKLLYFPEGFKPGLAKIRQTLIARYAFDALVSKDEQLRLFLNISYLGSEDGRTVHGFDEGARVYFGKKYEALTDDEFLSLVAMLISPNALTPRSVAHVDRMKRLHAFLAGEVQPSSLLDIEYKGVERGSIASEVLMVFLRLITDADPTDG